MDGFYEAIVVVNVLATLGAYVALALLAARPSKPVNVDEIASAVRRIDADVDDLFDRMKRLAGRKGVAAKREEVKNGAMMPGETPAEWKARMRKSHPNPNALQE